MTQLTEAQIRAKGEEWIKATVEALHQHEVALQAGLRHKAARTRVLQVEDEMRGMKQEVMALAATTAFA